MVVVEPVRAPLRVSRWPSAAEAEPDFAAIRAEFDVPEDFPADALEEAARLAARVVEPGLVAVGDVLRPV